MVQTIGSNLGVVTHTHTHRPVGNDLLFGKKTLKGSGGLAITAGQWLVSLLGSHHCLSKKKVLSSNVICGGSWTAAGKAAKSRFQHRQTRVSPNTPFLLRQWRKPGSYITSKSPPSFTGITTT